jgi:hypothetical protein
VLHYARYRCEHVDAHGARCTVIDPASLQAHHVIDLVAGGTNDPKANGQALCKVHHRALSR